MPPEHAGHDLDATGRLLCRALPSGRLDVLGENPLEGWVRWGLRELSGQGENLPSGGPGVQPGAV